MPAPDWLVERVLLDEAPPERRAEVDPERIADLAASSRQILEELRPAEVVAEIERRHRLQRADDDAARRRRARRGLALAGAAACAAALLFVLRPTDRPPTEPAGAAEVDRIKGDPRLVVYRKRGGTIEMLRRGSLAREGDLLQLSYVAAGRRFGAILSVDGRGQVTLHHPEAPGRAPALDQVGPIRLAHAYRLDDAPRFERFFFVLSARPFETDEVLAAAETLAPANQRKPSDLPLSEGFEQIVFDLRKIETP
jgi:hypothetical protein